MLEEDAAGRGAVAALEMDLGAALGTERVRRVRPVEAPLWQRVCPTVVCGPSGGGLHAVDEWVDLGQVRRFARSLAQVLGHPSAPFAVAVD